MADDREDEPADLDDGRRAVVRRRIGDAELRRVKSASQIAGVFMGDMTRVAGVEISSRRRVFEG